MTAPVTLTARALLLDMDGTLVDSTALVEEIWTMLARRFGHDPADLMRRIHGVRAADSIARFAPAGSDVPALLAELDRLELDGSPATVEIPGARDLVAALPAGSHALVTSAGPDLARARLAGAGIRVPDVVVSADDVTAGKPDPSGYLLAAERLGVDPADAIVYEDAEAGIRAGLAAGMRVVVVGDHASDATVGLPRVRDHRGTTVEVRDGVLTLTLPGDALTPTP
ncbi:MULTISPECIES: HAD-IA family hydrolase [Clavibacter]|uniref:2-deoxyglucose-6-phosphatase n=1 Tax=Clavibacter tessellarius TaxID=31965 RepID=A0A154V1X3_9MICO|nr:HAD-IA family hydrolase [Clavibacter michiganensis]KZC95368.1 2-deoxyglucose-6-phosphatase [Clavibacter michiganensis subsp. tessellarius]